MQRIERYGVIALVFLLVTILAVAVWGQRKNQSLLSIFKRDKTAEVAKVDDPTTAAPLPTGNTLGLSNPTHELTPGVQQPVAGAGPSDPALTLNPPVGPGLNVVTFDQGPQLPQNNKLNSGLIVDTAPVSTGTTGVATPIPGAPADAGARLYKVKPGDTLGTIAQRELGSTKRWKEIEALNGVKPERLKVGMELKLPLGAASLDPQVLVKNEAAVESPKPSSSRSYSVRTGDSLSKIAAAQLGDANRYAEILALNPGLNPQKLSVGQSLRLPGDARAVATVTKPKARPAAASAEIAKADPPKKARVQ